MLAEERARLMQLAGEMATIAHHIESHRGDVNLFRCGVLKSLCKKCHDGLTESGKPKPKSGDRDGYPVEDPAPAWPPLSPGNQSHRT
jgi:hypothetical protein